MYVNIALVQLLIIRNSSSINTQQAMMHTFHYITYIFYILYKFYILYVIKILYFIFYISMQNSRISLDTIYRFHQTIRFKILKRRERRECRDNRAIDVPIL